jgi:hypothetical protein
MKRFRLDMEMCDPDRCGAELSPADDGEWVEYEAMRKVEAENEQLRGLVVRFSRISGAGAEMERLVEEAKRAVKR